MLGCFYWWYFSRLIYNASANDDTKHAVPKLPYLAIDAIFAQICGICCHARAHIDTQYMHTDTNEYTRTTCTHIVFTIYGTT